MSQTEQLKQTKRRYTTKVDLISTVKLTLILKTLTDISCKAKSSYKWKKHFVGTRKMGNGKEKGTQMKDEKKEKTIWKLYENLNIEDCLK